MLSPWISLTLLPGPWLSHQFFTLCQSPLNQFLTIGRFLSTLAHLFLLLGMLSPQTPTWLTSTIPSAGRKFCLYRKDFPATLKMYVFPSACPFQLSALYFYHNYPQIVSILCMCAFTYLLSFSPNTTWLP